MPCYVVYKSYLPPDPDFGYQTDLLGVAHTKEYAEEVVRDYEACFKQWDDGNDETDVEFYFEETRCLEDEDDSKGTEVEDQLVKDLIQGGF